MSANKRKSVKGDSFPARLEAAGHELRAALLPLVEHVTDGILRPSRLVKPLGLDKTLASRVIQALNNEDPLELLHRIPAPPGLRILSDAARRHRAPSKLCNAADRAIETYQAMIDSTPGGRAGIDGWIASHSPAARERNEHNAKQAVFRGMSYVLGCHCETMATSLVIHPAEDGHVDCFEVHQRVGLRRLRPSAPVALFSVVLNREYDDSSDTPWLETLDGEIVEEDPERFLLPEFSSDPMPGIEVVRRGQHAIFALAENDLSLEQPINLSSGYIVRHTFHQESQMGQRDESRSYLLNYPCKTLIREVYLHEDLWGGVNPEIDQKLPNPSGSETERFEGFLGRINTIDMNLPIEQLGKGLSRCELRELPRHATLLRDSFERVGWDPDRFRGYRTRVTYPLPMVTMTWWFRLPS